MMRKLSFNLVFEEVLSLLISLKKSTILDEPSKFKSIYERHGWELLDFKGDT